MLHAQGQKDHHSEGDAVRDAISIYLLYRRAGNSFLVALQAAMHQLKRDVYGN